MGNGVSGDQGNLPSHGKRDVRATCDRKQHDWSELARAQEVNTLMSNVESYRITNNISFVNNSRAVAGMTARCRSKFRYISKFTAASLFSLR